MIIICGLWIIFPEVTDAQRILGGISVGMNLTQVDGDEYYGFHKVGLNVGPMVIVPFGKNKKWSVSMELLYSQKGSHHGGNTDTTTYNFKLDYLEIPVLLHFTDKKIISGGIGFSYGQLVNQKEDTSYYVQPITGLSKSDISLIADPDLEPALGRSSLSVHRCETKGSTGYRPDKQNQYVDPEPVQQCDQYSSHLGIQPAGSRKNPKKSGTGRVTADFLNDSFYQTQFVCVLMELLMVNTFMIDCVDPYLT